MALQEAEVLELSVIPLGLDETPLLDVHHLPEAVCVERARLKGRQRQALLLTSPPSLLRMFLFTPPTF